jgi:hypothetical protein
VAAEALPKIGFSRALGITSVRVIDGVTTVVPGTSDTYTITVTNNGPGTVSSLTQIRSPESPAAARDLRAATHRSILPLGRISVRSANALT